MPAHRAKTGRNSACRAALPVPQPEIRLPMSHSTHLLRRIWFNRYIWQRRGIFWIGGLLIGIVTVAFAWAADYAQHLFKLLVGISPYAPLVVTPAGLELGRASCRARVCPSV